MYKVLIVSGSPQELNTISHIINWEDYGFEIAGLLSDSLQALSFIKSHTVDVLIVDARLPQMDGIKLAQNICFNSLPIRCLFWVGQEDFFYVLNTVSMDIQSFLLKPFAPQLLWDDYLSTVQKSDPCHDTKQFSDNQKLLCELPGDSNWNYLSVPINHIFERSLINQKYAQCFSYLDYLFSHSSSGKKLVPSALKNQAIELVVYIINVLRSCSIDVSDISKDGSEIFSKILQFQDMQELHIWMKEFLTASVNALESQKNRCSPCISRVVDQIEKRFAQDISLKAIARDLNINAAYLGQRFKLETGQYFSAYVNQTRIEYAKKLLAETNYSLNKISDMCGYFNISYFYNIFKKLTGQTPSQYRISKTK